MAKHTYQTGIIGNCSYIAHIHRNTNVAWMCWPRFDSSFIFGGMLDDEKGGEFTILPNEEYNSNQYYLENTNVLCTEISCESGGYRIIDYAPRFFQYERYFRPLMLIRKIEPVKGLPKIRVRCCPQNNYGEKPYQAIRASNHIEYAGDGVKLRLTTNIPVSYVDEGQYFVLSETKYLVMTYGKHLEAPLVSTAENFLRETILYWRSWIKQSSIATFYQEYVIRSALALKIHQFEDTGAIIAASTTSLPEHPGSVRNWDYRYCWLRDTFYVLQALHNIGHFEELEKYFAYITDISFGETADRYQPLYGITGEKKLTEHIIDLKGYLGNKPVRIGNQAFEHIQNDIYGQVLISLLPLYTDQRFIFSERKDSAKWVEFVLEKIEMTVDEKDAGIWEFRNFENIHCYTNLFQWAGGMAAKKMAKYIGNKALERRASAVIKKASANIESCYDPVRKVYTHAYKSPYLDASTLQLVVMGYLKPDSPRAKHHIVELEKELKSPTGLFYRYVHADDFGKPKSTFLICAFWYIEALACVGRLDDAVEEFGKIMQYSNHLLLFSEDVDETDGSQWGNFPQAYSHVGLMNAAYRISRKLDKPIFSE